MRRYGGQGIDAEVGADLDERSAAIRLAIPVEGVEHGADHQRIPVAGDVHRARDGQVGRADQHTQASHMDVDRRLLVAQPQEASTAQEEVRHWPAVTEMVLIAQPAICDTSRGLGERMKRHARALVVVRHCRPASQRIRLAQGRPSVAAHVMGAVVSLGEP